MFHRLGHFYSHQGLKYRVSESLELYLLFTLYALYVHPDTLRILSAALPCLCGFCSTYWDRE
jgi:hypothetical protein